VPGERAARDEGLDIGLRALRVGAWPRAQSLASVADGARVPAVAELEAEAAQRALAIARPKPRLRVVSAAAAVTERGTVAEILDDIAGGSWRGAVTTV
jgi:hypothetical protein